MFLRKWKLAVIALLLLGLVDSGSGFVARRTGAEPPAPKPKADKPAKTPEEMTALLQARAAVAEKVYRAAFEGLTHTRRIQNVLVQVTQNSEDVYIWSVRWLQAQRDRSPKHEDQVAALEAHLQRMTEMKKVIKELSRDLMPLIKVDEAEWYRLEAELWLVRAKAAK